MKKILWTLLILIPVASIVGSKWYIDNAPASGTPAPKTTTGDKLPTAIWAIGFVDAEQGVADLYPSQPGEIVKLVEEGKAVEAGDLLLEVDSRLPRLQLDKAEAAVKAAKDKLK